MQSKILAAAAIAASQPLCAFAASDNLEQITVTASRVEMPRNQSGASVSVLTAEDIERLGYVSLLDAVRTLPGISVSNSGGPGKVSALNLRGESGFRTLVLLDGVNIADPTNVQVAAQFQHLLAADIERIEVLRGPQGMMYGAGAGGVVNIITRRAEESLAVNLGAETGRYGSRQLRAGASGSAERWNYGVRVTDFTTDGFNARESDTSGERDGYDNRTFAARLGYQVTENFSLEGQARRTDTETEFDGCFDAAFAATNDCLDEFAQTSYQLRADARTGSVAHQLLAARQEIERDSLAAGDSSFAVEGVIRELNYTGNIALNAGQLLWGTELEQQTYRQAGGEEEVDSLGVFGEWRGELAQQLHYGLGYRRDRLDSDHDSSNHNSWRASLAHPRIIGENQQLILRSSYSTGFRAPSPFEIAYNAAENVAAVGPETSRGYEFGAEYALAELLRVELVYFRQKVRDAIIFDSTLGGGWGAYGQDDGQSRSKGVELALSGELAENLGWYANGTWLDARDTLGERRLQIPRRLFNLGLNYTLLENKLTLSGNWQRVEDRLSPNPVWFGEDLALDNYGKLDVTAAYQWTQTLRLTLRGENILDEDYREVAGYHTAGAAVYAGVQLTL